MWYFLQILLIRLYVAASIVDKNESEYFKLKISTDLKPVFSRRFYK